MTGELIFLGLNPKYPFSKKQVQPASIDLRLGNRIVQFNSNLKSLDIKNIDQIKNFLEEKFIEDGESIIIPPSSVIFGEIYEQMSISDHVSARIEGRSRAARLGISIHCTGDYINPGFIGTMPLQIINHNAFPVILYPYISICQIFFYQLTESPLIKYSQRATLPWNRYYNEVHPSPSILSANPDYEIKNHNILMEEKIEIMIKMYNDKLQFKSQDATKEQSGQQTVINNYIECIKGMEVTMRDQYNAKQGGIMGNNAGANATVVQQYSEHEVDSLDIEPLIKEIYKIKEYVRNDSDMDCDTKEILIGNLSELKGAIKEQNSSKIMNYLKKGGVQLYSIAKSIGCSVVVKYLSFLIGF